MTEKLYEKNRRSTKEGNETGEPFCSALNHLLRDLAEFFLGEESFDEGKKDLIFFMDVIDHELDNGPRSFRQFNASDLVVVIPA